MMWLLAVPLLAFLVFPLVGDAAGAQGTGGVEPGPLGHVYLVPFRNGKTGSHEVVWLLGYTGIVELGRRGGAVGLQATLVHDGDTCEKPWQNEKGWHWEYRPAPAGEQGERVGVLVTWREERERVALWCPPERVDTTEED